MVISGGGRCNVTTGVFDKKTLETKYTRGFDFFENSLSSFSPKKTKKWFESHNLPLKIQEDLRIFPVSDDGDDVLAVFENIFTKFSDIITIHFGKKINNIEKKSHKFLLKFTENPDFEADFVVIATGGNAYRHTGSTGDGYAFAKNLGHSITTLGPSLSSFLVKEDFLKNLSGTTFPNAKIRFANSEIIGSLLATHFGIS